MEKYKPNSHKSRELNRRSVPDKKVEKIVTGKVRSKKKNELNKFTDIFISEDANNVKSYIFLDILVPAIKKAISDIVTNGIDMILYGETGRSKNNSNASRISYRSYYDRGEPNHSRTRTGYNYGDIILNNISEVEEVISRMDELISTYGLVSVADLYDLIGVTGNYTDNKYGWTDIRSTAPVRLREGGYLLKLPKALPLN